MHVCSCGFVCVCVCVRVCVCVILAASPIMPCLNMRELFETRESCRDQTTTHTQSSSLSLSHTHTRAQTHVHPYAPACLYIISHTDRVRKETQKCNTTPPPTALINKGQLAIIISIFNQSPVVSLCGLSFNNGLSLSLSLFLSLSFFPSSASLAFSFLLHVTLLSSSHLLRH